MFPYRVSRFHNSEWRCRPQAVERDRPRGAIPYRPATGEGLADALTVRTDESGVATGPGEDQPGVVGATQVEYRGVQVGEAESSRWET